MDTIEVIDSNIIEAIKPIRCQYKNRPDENTIVNCLCKSHPDCNVTTICQTISYLGNKNKHCIKNEVFHWRFLHYDDSGSLVDQQLIPLFDPKTPRVNKIKEQITLTQDLNEKIVSPSTEINALKSFVLDQVFIIKKTKQDIQKHPNNKETNNDYVMWLIDEIKFLKEENKKKNSIILILSENQSYFSKQFEKQVFVFPKKVSQEKTKTNSKDLKTSNRFSVLARENASDLQPSSLTIALDEQSCTKKDITSLRVNVRNAGKYGPQKLRIWTLFT